MRTTLIVFARVPRHGTVKTRVAARVGPARALEVHRELLVATLRALGPVPGGAPGGLERELCIDGDDVAGECAALAQAHGYRLTRQPGGDLGERMADVLEARLAAHRLPIVVGSDCPVLRASDVAEAIEALRAHDAVLAPARDGGYALVGVRRPLRAMFDGIVWSTTGVLEQTRARLRGAGASWHELRTVSDVDTWDDYLDWRASAGAPGPHTGR